jgi:hypothetical protein
MHWEIGLTFQCSGLICSASQMKSGLLLRLSWVPYTGFLLHCSLIPDIGDGVDLQELVNLLEAARGGCAAAPD